MPPLTGLSDKSIISQAVVCGYNYFQVTVLAITNAVISKDIYGVFECHARPESLRDKRASGVFPDSLCES